MNMIYYQVSITLRYNLNMFLNKNIKVNFLDNIIFCTLRSLISTLGDNSIMEH